MDAMATRSTKLSQLWQAPLLLVSVGLFVYAAWLFIDPKPGLTVDQKIDVAAAYLQHQRPEAAIQQLNRLLTTDKLDHPHEARVHLMLAEALDAGQKLLNVSIPANYQRMIEQTQLAMGLGAKPTEAIYQRLGESYEALNKPTEALANYRQAMALDPKMTPALQKKVIDLQIAAGEDGAAQASIDQYLKNDRIADAERGWAMRQQARLLVDQQKYVEAQRLLKGALPLSDDPVEQGAVHYWLGYCAWKQGDDDQADRLLRVAREQLRVGHPLDADACYVLGRIAQQRNKPKEAESFYQIILTSHPDAPTGPLALLGRATCRIMQGQDDAGMHDLQLLTSQINARPERASIKPQVLDGLTHAVSLLSAKEHYRDALEVMNDQLALNNEPPSDFYAQLIDLYDHRAQQLQASLPQANEAEKAQYNRDILDLTDKAGDACVALSRSLVMRNDGGYGQALWRGVGYYDKAGDMPRLISSLQLFIAQRPDDPLAPEAMLRLGQAYQAAGDFDKAIDAFQRNEVRYPQSLAASKSAVPLAKAYIAKGRDFYPRAETVLLSVFNNPALTPDAEEFKQALFDLGQLYYRTGRYEEAVMRLEEWTKRYPNEPRIPRMTFMMADSYRKSAAALGGQDSDALASASKTAGAASAAADKASVEKARTDRLTKAKALFDKTVELYRASPPQDDLDKLYEKLSGFYRADCVYDLGDYEAAIKLYDAAAFRYQDDASALAAYVQIVNAYCALGKFQQAKAANERAKWLLQRMPSDAFDHGQFTLSKEYWQQWLKWTSQSGLWK
jgi:tetratricopeptide (TPR) repeat protein